MALCARDVPRAVVPFVPSEPPTQVNESKRNSKALFCNLGNKNWLVLEAEKNLDLSPGSQYARLGLPQNAWLAEVIQREQRTIMGI